MHFATCPDKKLIKAVDNPLEDLLVEDPGNKLGQERMLQRRRLHGR